MLYKVFKTLRLSKIVCSKNPRVTMQCQTKNRKANSINATSRYGSNKNQIDRFACLLPANKTSA